MAKIIDGKRIAAETRARIRKDTEHFIARTGITPGLAVIIVGDNPASQVYVRNKKRACEEAGMNSWVFEMPAFHIANVGRIMIGNYDFLPCTPAGVMKLLEAEGIDPCGKECVVVGRSNIVGKPQAMLLLHANATVTICHSKTVNLAEVTRRADILVVAVGKADFITGDMVKEGAVVIDVGMNRRADGKLTGDVDFESVSAKASAITPVPGGVGPMTITMLLENTLTAAEKAAEKR